VRGSEVYLPQKTRVSEHVPRADTFPHCDVCAVTGLLQLVRGLRRGADCRLSPGSSCAGTDGRQRC
ncbi:MAG: hypothetical protein ACK5AN_24590, partial [Planctomyces sp.]